METMKVPVEELSIFVGLDGLAMLQHERADVMEELTTVGTAEALLRALEAQRLEKELKLHRLPD
jgi:hypothetical protein